MHLMKVISPLFDGREAVVLEYVDDSAIRKAEQLQTLVFW